MTTLKVGDEVQWMTLSGGKNSMSFRTRYGTIESFYEEGDKARIKIKRSGRFTEIATRRLVPIAERSPVNHVFGALTESHPATRDGQF